MDLATELVISEKIGDDGNRKEKSNILEETIDVQSPLLLLSQEPEYHDFDKESNVLNETVEIKSPPVPTRLILGPLRSTVRAGSTSGGENQIEAEVIEHNKEAEEKACHDKLVKEEMNRFRSNVIIIHPAQEIPTKELPEKIKVAGLKPFKVTIKEINFDDLHSV